MKHLFSEKINKIYKPLARLTEKKRENSQITKIRKVVELINNNKKQFIK